MKSKKLFLFAFILPVVAAFAVMTISMAGCGSSSGPASGNGVFADAPVVGLTYTCGTQTGATGTGGTFKCPGGSTVTFSVGGITLCTESAQAFMTPLSCAQATDPSANASTPSVLAVTQFLMSISTTPASSGALTITPSELQAAANLTLNFSTATDAQLLAAVDAISPGATLVDATTAENEIISTVDAAFAGNYSGTWTATGVIPPGANCYSGTWTVVVSSSGVVSGSSTATSPGSCGSSYTIAGDFNFGTTFSGTTSNPSIWTGTLDTSKTPAVFSGTWTSTQLGASGTFTGTKQ